MSTFDQIEYVLANYFSVDRELTEEEAFQFLRSDLASDRLFADDLRKQLSMAFKTPSFSWQDALRRNEVLTTNHEFDAERYAKKIFADAVGVEAS